VSVSEAESPTTGDRLSGRFFERSGRKGRRGFSRRILGIRQTLFIAFFALSVAPIIALTMWIERSALDKEIDAVREKHLIVADNLAIALSRYIVDVKQFFLLASNPRISLSAIETFHEAMDSLDIEAIMTVTSGGAISTVKGPKSLPQDIQFSTTDLDSLRVLIRNAADKIAVSGIAQFGSDGRFLLAKETPDGGFSIALISPRYIRKLQKSIAFGERGHSMIVDQYGRVVAHPDEGWVKGAKDVSKLSVVKLMIGKNTGVATFYSPAMKADMIAGYTYVPETGWGVMVPQPMQELVDRAHDLAAVTLLIAALGLLLALVLSWVLSRYYGSPITLVAGVASTTADHELSTRVSSLSRFAPSELKVLARAFNEMMDRLETQNKSLISALYKSESGNRAKSQFLAMMSHEMRTPLNGIAGILDIVQETKLDAKQANFIATALMSAEQLNIIIDDVLDFSKLEAGKIQIESKPFDPRTVFTKVAEFYRPICDDRMLKLNLSFASTIPDIVVSDSQRIRQIAMNFMSNAVKFTEKGQLDLEVSGDFSETGQRTLRFQIRDTGIGISSEDQIKLFDEFFQSDTGYSRRFGGTGLGLAISMRLARLMKGNIYVESEIGVGSAFICQIPVLAENAVESPH
jgi:signal transduction histidine kinase